MGCSDADDIARALASREPRFYEPLVRRYQSDIRNWLRALTKDAAWADDLAQETFIRAWQRLHTFRAEGSFKAWLMKIAYRSYLESRRRHRRAERLLDAVSREQSIEDQGIEHGPDASAADLPKLLAAASEAERTALILCYAHGMSHAEIADVTAMPIGTVKSHIRRGTRRIRERFGIMDDAND
jgi:RNA polymerase sigma-70 factor (ECF subfamily)